MDEKAKSDRRKLLQVGGATAVAVMGGTYIFSDSLTREAQAQTRADGRKRVPPGQRVLRELKPMGGRMGNPSRSKFRLRVHGEVETPLNLTYAELVKLMTTTTQADVHCVTGWSLLGKSWTGVTVADLARRAKIKPSARHVIFEAAHGYTANIPRKDALKPDVMLINKHDGKPLGRAHGGPVRALVPDLYFWKSAKWLTGIRFVRRDDPGYWETRGYHNYGDPWREQRYG